MILMFLNLTKISVLGYKSYGLNLIEAYNFFPPTILIALIMCFQNCIGRKLWWFHKAHGNVLQTYRT